MAVKHKYQRAKRQHKKEKVISEAVHVDVIDVDGRQLNSQYFI